MSEWKECKIGDVCDTQTGPFGSQLHNEDYVEIGTPIVTVEHLGSKYFTTQNLPCVSDEDKQRLLKYTLTEGDVVFSRVGSVDRCSFVSSSYSGWLFSGRCLRVRSQNNELLDSEFLFYHFSNERIKTYIRNIAVGATMPSINTKLLNEVPISLPPLSEQKKIAAVLSALDEKIETNRKINARLEELAQAIFKSWFIDFEPFGGSMPQDWTITSLSNIANYMNGLAMQKYHPVDNEDKLPVLKIKELGEGSISENSDMCSKSTIGTNYIIEDGDIIFSWSGTLLVKMWSGGKCGLNQHLFKVTSTKYPKWFYFYWTLYHNENFKRIAKDKAVTMGHIKRGELDNAHVTVPTSNVLKQLDICLAPILNQLLYLSKESARLAELRDSLLPKLMSGELKPEECHE